MGQATAFRDNSGHSLRAESASRGGKATIGRRKNGTGDADQTEKISMRYDPMRGKRFASTHHLELSPQASDDVAGRRPVYRPLPSLSASNN